MKARLHDEIQLLHANDGREWNDHEGFFVGGIYTVIGVSEWNSIEIITPQGYTGLIDDEDEYLLYRTVEEITDSNYNADFKDDNQITYI